MKAQNESLTLRIDQELSAWLKQKATIKNCKISDLVRESILKFKEAETVGEDPSFTSSLHTKSSKAAIMTYRLMEMLTNELVENGKELIAQASSRAKEDLDNCKSSNKND